MRWIKLYYPAILKKDKSLIANAFALLANQNNKYTILIIIDVYGIGICQVGY